METLSALRDVRCFLVGWLSVQVVEETIELLVIGEAMTVVWLHCTVISHLIWLIAGCWQHLVKCIHITEVSWVHNWNLVIVVALILILMVQLQFYKCCDDTADTYICGVQCMLILGYSVCIIQLFTHWISFEKVWISRCVLLASSKFRWNIPLWRGLPVKHSQYYSWWTLQAPVCQ